MKVFEANIGLEVKGFFEKLYLHWWHFGFDVLLKEGSLDKLFTWNVPIRMQKGVNKSD